MHKSSTYEITEDGEIITEYVIDVTDTLIFTAIVALGSIVFALNQVATGGASWRF